VPGAGDQVSLGRVLAHHSLSAFSWQTWPLTFGYGPRDGMILDLGQVSAGGHEYRVESLVPQADTAGDARLVADQAYIRGKLNLDVLGIAAAD
jgi:hypothetical protein